MVADLEEVLGREEYEKSKPSENDLLQTAVKAVELGPSRGPPTVNAISRND